MEVMQTSEFESNSVLIGQIGKTTSYRVSDDPMLMSMLSTGFYQNPMKTMTQEILFNAWDAHHMGNCTDIPIEIHLNPTTGLVIRDFGPGIPEDMMDEIYCVYGASTKRKDSRQTGGFGLGSKSPYSYTDSFTVISMNQGKKSVYLMVRVSEKTGKPAMTKIMESPTEETGLMVTIPLKSAYDLIKIKQNIHTILAYSGIRAVLTEESVDTPVMFNSQVLEPGDVVFVQTNSSHNPHPIQGIYGGVKYTIESFDEFATDYDFLKQFTENHQILIGFSPNSLTPLPNREGLNMNAPTKEAVKIMLEKLTDKTKTMIDPLMKLLAKTYMATALTAELQPVFALTGAFAVSNYSTIFDSVKGFDKIVSTLNMEGSDKKFIEMIKTMMTKDSKNLAKFIEPNFWRQIVIEAFLNAYPAEIEMAAAYETGLFTATTFRKSENFFADEWNQKVLEKLYTFQERMRAEFPDTPDVWPAFRYGDNTQVWGRIYLHKTDDGFFFYYTPVINDKWNSIPLSDPLLDATVFIGKNTFCLRDTHLGYDRLFNKPFTNYTLNHCINKASEAACIGLVVYARKGAYAKAMEILTDMDFDIHLADDVVRTVYKAPKEPEVVKTLNSYPALVSYVQNFNDESLVEDPTHMLYITKRLIKSNYQRDKPSHDLVRIITSRFPKTAWISNAMTQAKLEKEGVINFHSALNTWFNSLTTKKYHFRNIVRAIKISHGIGPYSDLLKEPMIHEVLGITSLKPEETESFWKEFEEYNALVQSDYREVVDIRNKANKQINEVWKTDPMRNEIHKNINIFEIFNSNNVKQVVNDTNLEKRNTKLKAINRLIRDFKT